MSKAFYLSWMFAGVVAGVLVYFGTNLTSFDSGLNEIKTFLLNKFQPEEELPVIKKPLETKKEKVKEAVKGWHDGPRTGAKLFTDEEIRYVDGGKPLLVILGHVFDVTKGFKSYGPGSGYHGFVGRDGSRAFVTGDFTADGLTSNLEGLNPHDYDGIAKWVDFYFQTYSFEGYHIGRFFDENGQETKDMAAFKDLLAESQVLQKAEGDVKKAFPPCNMEWKAETGTKYWCSKKSGGIDRDWDGYPHLFTEDGGKSARCACIKELGSNDRRIRQYEDCAKDSKVCFGKKD